MTEYGLGLIGCRVQYASWSHLLASQTVREAEKFRENGRGSSINPRFSGKCHSLGSKFTGDNVFGNERNGCSEWKIEWRLEAK